jgi:pyruvate kinase
MRRTKIVASMGPATDDPAVMDDLIREGVDVARFNLSHGSADTHIDRCRLVRETARARGRSVASLFDLQGPKIRISSFSEGRVSLRDGLPFILDAGLPEGKGTETSVGITYRDLARDVARGDTLLLDDGAIVLWVEKVEGLEVHTRVVVGGELSNFKGINRQGGGLSAAALTPKDEDDIRLAAELEADYLAVSFVRNAEDVEHARALLRAAGGSGKIVAKIERSEAVDRIEEILGACDVIMIARGDLGVEIGDADLPGVQKKLISEARRLSRVTITATQMMQSMVESAQPTRAEVLDVANAVLDGTDAVMLSAETAVGKHPPKVVAAMDRVCKGAERHRIALVSGHRLDARFETTEEAVAMAAMYTANHYNVAAILALTESGTTPMWMSRISSGIPIFAATRVAATERRTALYRGVYPIPFDATSVPRGDVNRAAVEELLKRDLVHNGDRIIITKGDFSGVAGGTNAMKVVTVGEIVGERE